MALLGQLTSINGCLLMHFVLVQINELKYNSWKQKSIWLVMRYSDNQDSNYWTVFYKVKKFGCSSEK